jgi:hypothetical protein
MQIFPFFLVIKIESRTNMQLNISHDINRTPVTIKKPFFPPYETYNPNNKNKIVLKYNLRHDGMPQILKY